MSTDEHRNAGQSTSGDDFAEDEGYPAAIFTAAIQSSEGKNLKVMANG